MEIIDNRQNWKEAFNCKKCLKKERTLCPCYVEYTEVNNKTGETRLVKTCIFQLLPRLLIDNTKASDGLHGIISSMRNKFVEQTEKILQLKEKELKKLEDANI